MPITLGFLKRCGEDVHSVMYDVNGDISNPVVWVVLLGIICRGDEAGALETVNNIGPLINCMCDDSKRQFFRSKQLWFEALRPFIILIYSIVMKSPSITRALFRQKKLLDSIIQWGFLDTRRPDILNEAKAFGFLEEESQLWHEWARLVIYTCSNADTNGGLDTLTEEDKFLLRDIATTSVVSKTYNADCKVSLVAGMIPLLKTSSNVHRNFQLRALTRYISHVDCVDKGVISAMMDLDPTFNIFTDYHEACEVMKLTLGVTIQMKHREGVSLPSDRRCACAIRKGLLEKCLYVISRFGSGNDGRLIELVTHVVDRVYEVSHHKKSARAIRDRRHQILNEIQTLEVKIYAKNDNECNNVVGTIKSIVDLNGSASCSRCDKLIDRSCAKFCGGCNRVAYCSKQCQQDDWQNGTHQTDCDLLLASDTMNTVGAINNSKDMQGWMSSKETL